jgi:hypothetical protein
MEDRRRIVAGTLPFFRRGLVGQTIFPPGLVDDQHYVTVNTTRDMTMMPYVVADAVIISRDETLMADVMQFDVAHGLHRRIAHTVRGRLIDFDDYINNRPVVVINSYMHRNFGLDVGDTIIVDIYADQTLTRMRATTTGVGIIYDPIIAVDFLVPPERVLRLEVVGIFYNLIQGYGNVAASKIYIPDSILQQVYVEGMDGLWASQYSFVLENARFEQQFYLEYREKLAEMGVDLSMLWSGAGEFWQIMDSTLLISAFNLGLTGGILLLVLALSSFVFLRQRLKDLAISRAIGTSVKKALAHLALTVFLFGIPAAAIGGGGALAFVNSDFYTSELLVSLVDTPPPPNIEGINEEWAWIVMRVFEANLPPQIVPEIFSLEFGIALCAAIFALLFVFVMAGSVIVIKRPVLEMLQGRSGVKGVFAEAVEEECETVMPNTAENEAAARDVSFPTAALSFSLGRKFAGRLLFMLRQIVRSPQKSLLTLSIALLFTISMVYLQESMVNTQQEIDRLYDETVVRAEITAAGTLVPRRLVDLAEESGMATNIYYEASFLESFLIAPDETGGIPENWQHIIAFNPTLPMNSQWNRLVLNHFYGVTDFEMFIEVHSNINSNGVFGSVHIDFAPGLDASSIVYVEGSPLPIIVTEQIFVRRGLSLGDEMLLAMRVPRSHPIAWESQPVVIAGIHNGHVRDGVATDAIIVPMPFEVLEDFAGRGMEYFRLNFDVTPAYNRHLDEVLSAFGPNFIALGPRPDFMLWDSQLNELTGAMEWVLLFLELLYPITLFVAGAISLVLSMLLIMQMRRSAAIMRTLGASKRSVCNALFGELFAPFLLGILLGLAVVFALDWGLGPLTVLTAVAVSLVGAIIGSMLAVIIVVVVRPPIAMLQIRE